MNVIYNLTLTIKWLYQIYKYLGFPDGAVVKNVGEGDARDVVWSLSLEDPLEKGMATHSSILAWRIPWTEEPGGS